MNKLDIRNAVREAITSDEVPSRHSELHETVDVPKAVKTFGEIKLVFRNLRNKGYEYSACDCYLSDSDNSYYSFKESEFDKDSFDIVKKIVGHALTESSKLSINDIMDSFHDLIWDGESSARIAISDGFEEVAIYED